MKAQLSVPVRRRAPKPGRVALAVIVALATGAAALALTRLDLSRTLHALENVTPILAVVTFVLMAISLIARTECWYVILRGAGVGLRISRLASARATMIGVMVSATLPGRLGEPMRVLVIARRVGDTRTSLAFVAGTVLAQTLLNMAAMVAIASVLVASVALFANEAWAIAAAAAVPVIVLGAILTGPGRLQRVARRNSALGRAAALVRTEIEHIRGGLRVFTRPLDAVHAGGAQFGAWLLQLLACYALLGAFAISTPSRLGAAAAVLIATNVAAVLPVTPGNVGVFQAACVAALAAYGVDAGRALAYGIVLQVLEVTTAITLGLPALVMEGLRPHDLRRASRRAAMRGQAVSHGDRR